MTTPPFTRRPAGSQTAVGGASRSRQTPSTSARQVLSSCWYQQRPDGLKRLRSALIAGR